MEVVVATICPQSTRMIFLVMIIFEKSEMMCEEWLVRVALRAWVVTVRVGGAS